MCFLSNTIEWTKSHLGKYASDVDGWSWRHWWRVQTSQLAWEVVSEDACRWSTKEVGWWIWRRVNVRSEKEGEKVQSRVDEESRRRQRRMLRADDRWRHCFVARMRGQHVWFGVTLKILQKHFLEAQVRTACLNGTICYSWSSNRCPAAFAEKTELMTCLHWHNTWN